MKKVILTFLGVLLFSAVSYAQDFATIINESGCDIRIEILFADADCLPLPSFTTNIKSGNSAGTPSPTNMKYITGARIWRYVPQPYYLCPQVYTMSPPATCGTCNIGEPSTISIPASGDCCQVGVAGSWTEISCVSVGNQVTELVFN